MHTTMTLVSEVESPAIEISPPIILGTNLDHSIINKQQNLWKRTGWPARSIRIFKIRDALVFQNGLILDQDLEPLPFLRTMFSVDHIERAQSYFRNHRHHQQPGSYVLNARPGGTCYGHILIEIISSRWYIDRTIFSEQKNYTTTSYPSIISTAKAIVPIYGQISELLTNENRQLLNIGGQGGHFEEIYAVEGFAETGEYISPFIQKYAGDILKNTGQLMGKRRRIAILRDENQGRTFSNRLQLINLLERHGFDCVAPENLTIKEQVKLFQSAEIVLGAQGSALANMIFCDTGTPIISIAPDVMVDSFFWRLANVFGLRHFEIRSRTTESEKYLKTRRPLDRNMQIDLDSIEEAILRSLAAIA